MQLKNAAAAGGTSTDFGYGVAVDKSGNIYITGYYRTTATFGSTTLAAKGGGSMFVAKYDKTGKLLKAVNVVNAGTSGSFYSIGYDIAVDNTGNVYVTGTFYTTATTYATFGSLSLKTVGGNRDMFVAKLDSNLNFTKLFAGGGISSDYGYALAIDKSNNVFVTGSFYSTSSSPATFGSLKLTSKGSSDIFVLKLDNNLTLQKAYSMGGISLDVGRGIVTDSTNNVYIAGYWYTGSTGTTVLSYGSSTLKGTKDYDMFVAKFTNNLAITKIVAAKGSVYREYARDLAVDSKDNLYVTGHWFSNTSSDRKCTFGRVVLTNVGTSSYSSDIFVAKLDKNLNFTNAMNMGSTSSEYGYGIASDGTNVYVTGNTYAAGKFGTFTLSSRGSADVFVAKIDANFKVVAAQSAGGISSDYGYAIAADAMGNYFVTGYFSGTGFFGNTTLTSKGSIDIFVTQNLP